LEKRRTPALKSATQFDDIIGHEEVVERLRRDLAGGRLAHAYLFLGPRGTGKATLARITGAATLCGTPEPDKRPCGECAACGRIFRRNHPDFHELVPAEGRRWIRVDQVRKLQAALARRPVESDRRVAVVDGAERMNEAAQNAFLKTLEEPPAGTLIVLTAPGAHSLLPTIVSRCRIERFGPLKTGELARILEAKRGLDPGEARMVASLASGSVGDAMSMDMDFVRRARPAIINRIAEAVAGEKRNPEKILGIADQLAKMGDDSLHLLRTLLADVASNKMGRNIANIDLRDAIEKLSGKWDVNRVLSLFEKTLRAEEGLARNLNRAFLFENLMLAFMRRDKHEDHCGNTI